MPRRLDRVNELLRREISAIIQRDYEWHGTLVTVGDIEVTQDLKEARVWVGILGGAVGPVLEKLNREHGSIQARLMKRVVLKSTPVLHFHHDASAVRGVDLVNLLDAVEQLPKAPEEEPAEESAPATDSLQSERMPIRMCQRNDPMNPASGGSAP
ncbi:MAG: 30S ribosome-binding factor RbfA [Verrucomicrobia bacterium]|nr:30S ribosome-binding factor RbfA [Verrucomicrobiota bacterium]